MKRIILFCISFICIVNVYSQDLLTKNNVERLLIESPAFTIFKDNYFVSGTTLNESPDKTNSDVKFQVSFKHRLTNKPILSGFYPYLTYTQKSFWDIYMNSSPFVETNYNPTLTFIKPLFKDNYLNGAFVLSFEHESNGLDSISGSKSWNFIAGTYIHAFTPNLSTILRLWVPFGLTDNPNLMDYIGYCEAKLTWNIIENKLITELAVKKGARWDWKGNIELNISYRPFKNRNQYIMLQWFNGYAESLIDYKQKSNMLRIGFVLKPEFYKLY